MVYGTIIKFVGLGGVIAAGVLFLTRAAQIGIGPAGSEVAQAISNLGQGVGNFGSGISDFFSGIGEGTSRLFDPLGTLKDLIYGGPVSINDQTVGAVSSNTGQPLNPEGGSLFPPANAPKGTINKGQTGPPGFEFDPYSIFGPFGSLAGPGIFGPAGFIYDYFANSFGGIPEAYGEIPTVGASPSGPANQFPQIPPQQGFLPTTRGFVSRTRGGRRPQDSQVIRTSQNQIRNATSSLFGSFGSTFSRLTTGPLTSRGGRFKRGV